MGILQHQLSVWKAPQHFDVSSASLPFVLGLTYLTFYLNSLASQYGNTSRLIGCNTEFAKSASSIKEQVSYRGICLKAAHICPRPVPLWQLWLRAGAGAYSPKS